jgi:diguanylate cyclase (GGDEF)-like protein
MGGVSQMGWIYIIFLVLILILLIIAIYEYSLIKHYKINQELMEKVKERLYETSEKVLKAENEDEIYSIILDTAVDLIPYADKGSILLIDENEIFHYKVVKGFQEDLVNVTLKKQEAYLYNINEFKETAIISDPGKFDENFIKKETITDLRSKQALDIFCTISSPIYIDYKLIGLLNVDSSKPGHVFTKNELNLMNLIKSELQIALKNAFSQNRLKYLASFDELTGIMNRRCFNNIFINELDRIKRSGETLTVVMIDIDEFKEINDRYGHNFGDKVLKSFSQILEQCIRKSDVIARMSGDEFLILFRNCPMKMAKERMERITSETLSRKPDGVNINFSYGICETSGNDKLIPEEILTLADTRMYNNKKLKGVKR